MKRLGLFLHEKWRYITIGVIFLILLASVSVLFKINGASGVEDASTNSYILTNVYYITQIATSIAVMVGGVIGIWQYTLTARAERIKMSVDRIQKAIDLAEYYKNNILNNYLIIQFVFDETGLMNIIEKINREDIEVFDKLELDKLLSKNDIEQINTINTSDKFIKAVIEADKIYGLDLDIYKNAEMNNAFKAHNIEFTLNRSVIVKKFMSNIVTETLNNLEFFAMHFSHETADESVVYQSLHQTYLMIVYVLYYNIASSNRIVKSKHYTNIIELYKKWNERDKSEMNNKMKAARNLTLKGTTVEKIES